jgi:hypothetical protein
LQYELLRFGILQELRKVVGRLPRCVEFSENCGASPAGIPGPGLHFFGRLKPGIPPFGTLCGN